MLFLIRFLLPILLILELTSSVKSSILPAYQRILPKSARRTFTCSTTSERRVNLESGETVSLQSATSTSSTCTFRITAISGEQVYISCQTVNLPTSYSISLSSNNALLDSFTSAFTFDSGRRRVFFELGSDSARSDLTDAFSCEATAYSGSPPTEPPPPTDPPGPTDPPQPDTSCNCGVPLSDRIVGGQDAAEAEYPWMVSLNYVWRRRYIHYCGGTLVTSTKIITAAHCDPRTSEFAFVGQYQRAVAHNYTVIRQILAVLNHPQYDGNTLDNDISVVTIDSVEFNAYISPICLPTDNSNYEGETVTAAGWGTLSSGGSSPSTLQEVDVIVTSQSDCISDLDPEIVTDRMICADVDGGGKDTCQGDSGGPLMHLSSASGPYDLVGVTSWGIGCAMPDSPGVYTRVTEFTDWIYTQIGGVGETCERPIALALK